MSFLEELGHPTNEFSLSKFYGTNHFEEFPFAPQSPCGTPTPQKVTEHGINHPPDDMYCRITVVTRGSSRFISPNKAFSISG